jgi:hypothetical protein
MQESALADGAVLRHLHDALFSESHTARGVSRLLITLWVGGRQRGVGGAAYAPTKELLHRIFPGALLKRAEEEARARLKQENDGLGMNNPDGQVLLNENEQAARNFDQVNPSIGKGQSPELGRTTGVDANVAGKAGTMVMQLAAAAALKVGDSLIPEEMEAVHQQQKLAQQLQHNQLVQQNTVHNANSRASASPGNIDTNHDHAMNKNLRRASTTNLVMTMEAILIALFELVETEHDDPLLVWGTAQR